jgi:hypothetical protein
MEEFHNTSSDKVDGAADNRTQDAAAADTNTEPKPRSEHYELVPTNSSSADITDPDAAAMAPVTNPAVTAGADLDTLARQVRAARREMQNAMRTALRMALDAGDALITAKKQVEDGRWQPWLRNNCLLSVRTAELYMQLAQHREEIESELECVTTLSLSAARRLIMKPKAGGKCDTEDSDPAKAISTTKLDGVWDEASTAERTTFFVNHLPAMLCTIGLPELLAAMPAPMLKELERRSSASLAARCKTKRERAMLSRLHRRHPITIDGKATEISTSA